MTLYDPDARRLLIRIVYDGPAKAGKTTNVRHLERSVTPLRRGEMTAPGETAGRTLFFDWMDMEGGHVAGHALRCQLVTVPGQAVLGHRRAAILEGADAVVLVCDSTNAGLDEADGFSRSIERLTPPGTPVVVQANKQDAAGALSPDEVRRRLRLPPTVPVLPARANLGPGVRECLVVAIRAAADRAQALVLRDGTSGIAGRAERPEELHARLLDTATNPPASAVDRVLASASAAAPADEAAAGGLRLPSADVPSGWIWPPQSGRDTLRRIAIIKGEPKERADLVGRTGSSDGSGRTDTLILHLGEWCLKTAERRRFADIDEARAALVSLVRRKARLGELFHPDTVLSLEPEPGGGARLWTVTPWLPTIGAGLTASRAANDEPAITADLTGFAHAVARSLAIGVTRGLLLDIHPSNFTVGGGRLRYLDDDIGEGTANLLAGHAVLRQAEEHARWPIALQRYLEALVDELGRHLDRSMLRRAEFRRSLADAQVGGAAAGKAREALLLALPHA